MPIWVSTSSANGRIADWPSDKEEIIAGSGHVCSFRRRRQIGPRCGAAMSGRKLLTCNCHDATFIDLVTIDDAKGKSAEARTAIADRTKRVVDKARAVGELLIVLSGTCSQTDDPDRSALAAVIFGTEIWLRWSRRPRSRSTPTTGSLSTRSRSSSLRTPSVARGHVGGCAGEETYARGRPLLRG